QRVGEHEAHRQRTGVSFNAAVDHDATEAELGIRRHFALLHLAGAVEIQQVFLEGAQAEAYGAGHTQQYQEYEQHALLTGSHRRSTSCWRRICRSILRCALRAIIALPSSTAKVSPNADQT